MPTVLRVGNLRIVIFANDHRPAHVHIISPTGEAKVRIGTLSRKPSLLQNDGLSRKELGAALEIIDQEWKLLRQRWKEIHGNR
jgi:hypothetical protein